MKLKSRSITKQTIGLLVVFLGVVGFVLLVSNGSAFPKKPNLINQTIASTSLLDEWYREAYDVLPPPKTSYEETPDYAFLLNVELRRRNAQAELGLTEQQTVLLDVVRLEDTAIGRYAQHLDTPAEEPKPEALTGTYQDWLKEADRRIKSSFSPLQYVRFRDWMVEQARIELISFSIRANQPLPPTPLENRHLLTFLEKKIGLNRRELPKIEAFLNKEKTEKILPVRIELYDVADDPKITWEETDRRGFALLAKIRILSQSFDKTLLSLIPKDKQNLFRIYQSIPKTN